MQTIEQLNAKAQQLKAAQATIQAIQSEPIETITLKSSGIKVVLTPSQTQNIKTAMIQSVLEGLN